MAYSEIWFGDNLNSLAPLMFEITTTGFIELEAQPQGRYFAIRQRKQEPWYILNGMRVYQRPNLLQKVENIKITENTSKGLDGFSAENLITNLGQRSCGNGQKAIIDNQGTQADYESCFKTPRITTMRAEELNNYFILGVDLGSQHTLSSILIVEDMGAGNSWDEINIKANNHLENF